MLHNTDRSTNWALSNFRDWAKKKNINPTQEAMAVPLGKTVCKTWWINVCNSTAMGITRNKELLETRQIKTRQIKFFELLVLSGKARTSFTRSALAQNSTSTILSTKQTTMFYERSSAEQHKSASTILSTKQTTFQQQMDGPEQYHALLPRNPM